MIAHKAIIVISKAVISDVEAKERVSSQSKFSSFAYIMILASSMKSSSDMEPSLIILMATSCWPCHFPYFTTPN